MSELLYQGNNGQTARERAQAAQLQNDLEREAPGYWASALYALRRDKLTLAAFGLLLVMALLCVALARADYCRTGRRPERYQPVDLV